MRVTLPYGEEYKPTRATKGSAGFDLCSRENAIIGPGGKLLVGTGVYIELPYGWAGLIRSRSGLALKGIYAFDGTIDWDYRGEVSVQLINTSRDAFYLKPLDRIAQIVIVPVLCPELEVVLDLPVTARNDSGFGSTGK